MGKSLPKGKPVEVEEVGNGGISVFKAHLDIPNPASRHIPEDMAVAIGADVDCTKTTTKTRWM